MFEQKTFSLDIGQCALRLIQLRKSGKKIEIISYNEINIPEGEISDGEIRNPQKMAKLIDELIKKTRGKKISTRYVTSILPEPKTFIKLIEIFPKSEEDIEKLVEEKIKSSIPLSLEDIYFDWQIITQFKEDKNMKILVGAAPKYIVNSYIKTFEIANLNLLALEIEAATIIRSLLKERVEVTGAKIFIDIGAVRTGLILYDENTIQFTVSLPISGIKITQEISEILKISQEEAEKAKIVCGLDEKRCGGALKKILFSTINNLIEEINKAIDFYHNHFNNQNKISEIILGGGGANFINIDKVFSEKLNIPITIANPFSKVSLSKKISPLSPSKALSYLSAIGLALREIEK